MLNISLPAYDRLTEMLVDRPVDVAARICVESGRFHIRPGREQTGDSTVVHGGRTVLLIDRQAAPKLADRMLDVSITDNGPRLRLRRRETSDPTATA